MSKSINVARKPPAISTIQKHHIHPYRVVSTPPTMGPTFVPVPPPAELEPSVEDAVSDVELLVELPVVGYDDVPELEPDEGKDDGEELDDVGVEDGGSGVTSGGHEVVNSVVGTKVVTGDVISLVTSTTVVSPK